LLLWRSLSRGRRCDAPNWRPFLAVRAPALPPLVGPRRKARPTAVLDHPRALAQRDGAARPALDRGPIGRLRHLKVLDAGNVLDDIRPVRGPHVDAKGEMCSGYSHLRGPKSGL